MILVVGPESVKINDWTDNLLNNKASQPKRINNKPQPRTTPKYRIAEWKKDSTSAPPSADSLQQSPPASE
jgi:hypothetical protein